MRKNISAVREVTLAEILNARDERCEMQSRILSEYHSTLLSFTMNIAGPVKNTPLIERAFEYGLAELFARLPSEKILFKHIHDDSCGNFAIIALGLAPEKIKSICVDIEEATPLGRLFDMDVLTPSGEKLERRNQRSCIVCGKPGRECSAGRLHPVEQIVTVTNNIICDHFARLDAKEIGALATKSLIMEVETTPKPGLVDLRNNGSHSDMDVNTFRKSAYALESYFTECVSIGISTRNFAPAEAFNMLRLAGIQAEKTMYAYTNGVNTHKGLIYSMGVLLGAIGRTWNPEQPISENTVIISEVKALVEKSVREDLENANGTTAGERIFLKQGLTGIRGEVASGFSSVFNHSLPVYKSAISDGLSSNDAGVLSLLSLISSIEDTNIYNRGGDDGARFAKESTSALLKIMPDIQLVQKLDDEFIRRRLSPGGAADLLAITYFFHMIEKLRSSYT